MSSTVSRIGYQDTDSTTELTFSRQMRDAGNEWHVKVNTLPFTQSLVKGDLTEKQYCQYLVDIKEIYDQLETELRTLLDSEPAKTLAIEQLFRTSSIDKDLEAFGAKDVKPGESAVKYRNHLRYLGEFHPHKLVAHAYIRFLGDLFGGRVIYKSFEEKFEGKLAFYDFSGLCKEYNLKDPARFVRQFKQILDQILLTVEQSRDVLGEVAEAYQMHMAMFEELGK